MPVSHTNPPKKAVRREKYRGFGVLGLYNGSGLGLANLGDGETERDVERGQIRQRVDDLQFYLYERALHPELFQICAVRRFEQRRYQAEVWLLQLAHVVTLQTPNGQATELVASETDLLPKTGLATSFRFRGERDQVQALDNGITHILSSQVERMSPQVFPSSHRELARHAQRKGLYVPFEEWEADGMAPFSYVDFEARDHEFHVYAFHVFPDDLTILKTQSIFEIAIEKRPAGR